MKTKSEHHFSFRKCEKGNALIYVLIAIVLFAALSMIFGRQTGTDEAANLSDDKAALYTTQISAYAAQAKTAIDQMLFSGARLGNLVFTLPSQAGFNTPPNIYKVFHPEGGGLNPGILPGAAISQIDADPPAGWYIGAFNTIDWTKTSGHDVILVAYQINKKICENLNKKITGSAAIPELVSASIKNTMIDDAFHSGANINLTTDPAGTPICAACYKQSALCVKSSGAEIYGFYTVLEDQ